MRVWKGMVVLAFVLLGGVGLGSGGCSPSPTCPTCQEPTPDASAPDRSRPETPAETNPNGPRQPAVNLLDHSQWKRVPLAQDPYRDLHTSSHKCNDALSRKIEDDVLEIDTNECNFLTLEQRTQHEVRAGEMLAFVMWHLELYAPTPGEAYVVLTLDGKTVWEKKIPIPYKAEYYEHKWIPDAPIPQGVLVQLHLQNHGSNSWKIHSLTAGKPY